MLPESVGPQTEDSSSKDAYYMSTVEHKMRAGLAVGGRDTGLERAFNALDEHGHLQDYITGTKDTFERAKTLIDHPHHPVSWDTYLVVDTQGEGESLPDHVSWITTDDLNSVASLAQFGLTTPEELVVLLSPGAVNSSENNEDKYYAWAPTREDISVCACPAKWWQQHSSILCKHEMAALISIASGDFHIDDTSLDKAKRTIVSKKHAPPEPHPDY